MELSLYLEPNHCNEVHDFLLPTLGPQTKEFIQLLQMIAAIDKELKTPHLHQCLAKLQALDPNFSLDIDFFDPIHDYNDFLEKEKEALKVSFQEKPTVSTIKKTIRNFREKNETHCKKLIDLYEVKLERDRFNKIITSLQPSSYP